MSGYLILTAQEPRPELEEPEVATTLRQTSKKLSARQQKQITWFITVVAGSQKLTGMV
ncbi:hypothetical protein J2067_001123 [Erwinia rhapontici]|nr:hypothetical protein [Erwinia rhapontici]